MAKVKSSKPKKPRVQSTTTEDGETNPPKPPK
jgi:hypothetical protein